MSPDGDTAGLEDAQWHRLSPRMLIVHPVLELVRLLPAIAGIVLAGSHDNSDLVLGAAVLVLVTALAILRWFTTRLRITSEQVELRQGLVRRRSLSTRRDRIRTVDVTSHLLHRLLGLSRVVVGTGTSDRKGRDRLVLDGLTAAAARGLRDDLLHATFTPSPTSPDTVDPPAELARLDPRWIWFAPFTLSGVVTGIVVWGFFWRLQNDGVDVVHSGAIRTLTHEARTTSTVAVVIAVALVLVTFVAVTSVLGYVLAFWKFRLVRHGSGTLEVTRGLITTRSTSIERRRLVGLSIHEPLLLRAVGGARLLAVATGLRVGRGAERGGEALLPPAPGAVVHRVGREILDGAGALDVPLQAHGAAAARRRVVRALACAALVLVLAVAGWATGGSGWLVDVGVALVVLAPLVARDRYANLGHAVADGYLIAGTGSFVRRRTLLADEAIIGWNVRRSVFQRRSGLATLVATTAAGRQSVVVTDLAADEALDVADALTPELLTQFRPA